MIAVDIIAVISIDACCWVLFWNLCFSHTIAAIRAKECNEFVIKTDILPLISHHTISDGICHIDRLVALNLRWMNNYCPKIGTFSSVQIWRRGIFWFASLVRSSRRNPIKRYRFIVVLTNSNHNLIWSLWRRWRRRAMLCSNDNNGEKEEWTNDVMTI